MGRYGYHAYIAHGKTGGCVEEFSTTFPHDGWARVLYMIPRWLLHTKPNDENTVVGAESTRLNSARIRKRVDWFREGKWGGAIPTMKQH